MQKQEKPSGLDDDNPRYEDRVIQIVPTPWMEDPGASAPPLSPPADHLVKTLPEPDVCVYDGELPSPVEMSQLTRKYMQISSGLAIDRWMIVFQGIVGAFGLAMGVVWIIFLLEPPIDSTVILPIALGIAAVAGVMRFSWALLYMLLHSFKDEPLRFCRESGKVYHFRASKRTIMGLDVPTKAPGAVAIYDWKNLRAEITRHYIVTAKTARRDSFLQLAVLDPASGQVTERFRIGDRDHLGFQERVLLWETIRRFMEEGCERLPPARLKEKRENLAGSLDEFNPFSVPDRMMPGAQRFLGYVAMVVLWPISGFLILMALTRWIGEHTGREVDWGEYENTAFKLDADDPALTDTQDPSTETPKQWDQELKRRRFKLRLWLASLLVQWLLVTAWLHTWPYCSCYYPDSFCLPVQEICPSGEYYMEDGTRLMPAMPALPPPEVTYEEPRNAEDAIPDYKQSEPYQAYLRLKRMQEERERRNSQAN